MRALAGTLALVSNELATAKLHNAQNGNATLYCDAATIRTLNSNNRILMGDTGEGGLFTHARLGPGGLTFSIGGDVIVYQGFETAPGVAADGGISSKGAGVLKIFNAINTFNGGIDLYDNQLRFDTGAVFGSGALRLHEGGNAVVEGNGVVHVTNKVLFSNAGYMATSGRASDCLVLHNVAFPTNGENDWHNIHVGRVGQGFSRAAITLDGPDNDPIGNFFLRGALDFTIDGGLLRSLPACATPFFNTSQLASNTPPVATVGRGGFHFDTNGATTDLGLTLITRGGLDTNHVGYAAGFANPSFEPDASGWTWTQGSSKYGNGSRYVNSSGFTSGDRAYQTTNGTYYAVIRQLGSLAGSFTVPEDGDWRIAFEMGCRPEVAYATHLITVTVTIDAGTASERVHVIGPRAAQHPFTRFMTDPYPLTAGTHTIKLTADDGNAGNTYDSVLVDAFALERRVIASYPAPPVVKYGAGFLSVTNLVTDGTVAVSNGTLLASAFAFDGAAVDVAAGGTLAVCEGRFTNASVRVAAGGALSLRNRRNLLVDGDFEAWDAGPDGFKASSSYVCWRMSTLGAQTAVSGVQRNGGTVSANGWYATPCGDQTAYVRSSSKMTGTFAADRAGVYHLSFLHCARNYNSSYNLPIYVMVDGVTNLVVTPRTAYYDYTRETSDLELDAGDHTIVFEVGGGTQSGAMLFFDDIRIEADGLTSGNIAETRFDFEAGATLDLQNTVKIVLEEGLYRSGGVYVDGVRVQGGRQAFERLGVTVTGSGDIQVGPPVGTMLLIR